MKSIDLQVLEFNVKSLVIMDENRNPEVQKEKLRPLCLEYKHLATYSNIDPRIVDFIQKYSN